MKTQDVALGSIAISPLWASRKVAPENVAKLVESIKVVGVLQPIIVRAQGEGFELVAGMHRFEAAKAVGLKTIPASIIETGDDKAELSSLGENLHRFELEDEEWDTALARWRDLYETLNPTPSRKGGRPKKSKTGRSPTSFAQHAANSTGKGVTTIKQGLLRSTKLTPEARAAYRAGDVTKGQADELVKLPPEKQKRMLLLVSGKSVDETRALVKSERKGGSAEVEAAPLDPRTALVVALQSLVTGAARVEELLERERSEFDALAGEILRLVNESGLPKAKESRAFVEEVEAGVMLLENSDRGRATAFTEMVGALSAGIEAFTGDGGPRGSYKSRPRRWANAVAEASAAIQELIDLQHEYEQWGDTLPDNLRDGSVSSKIEDIVALDFHGALDSVQEAESADLPLGFGRD